MKMRDTPWLGRLKCFDLFSLHTHDRIRTRHTMEVGVMGVVHDEL